MNRQSCEAFAEAPTQHLLRVDFSVGARENNTVDIFIRLRVPEKTGCLKIPKTRHLSNVGIRSDAIGMKKNQENERLRDGV